MIVLARGFGSFYVPNGATVYDPFPAFSAMTALPALFLASRLPKDGTK
jgi:hypothetical protein